MKIANFYVHIILQIFQYFTIISQFCSIYMFDSIIPNFCKGQYFIKPKSSPLSANVDDPNNANEQNPISFLNKVIKQKVKQKSSTTFPFFI